MNAPASSRAPLLSVRHLSVANSAQRDGKVILRDVSLDIGEGEIVALVGESGSGKSMLCQAILGLLPGKVAVTGGAIHFDGLDLVRATEAQLRSLRGRKIAMVFQNPAAALSPVHRIGTQLVDALRAHRPLSRPRARELAKELLAQVRIDDPDLIVDRYPHQLSGGMQQRVAIAIALSCDPELLLADEPTAALDVSIGTGIVELLKTLCRERQMGMLFVSHDLGLVATMAQRIVIARAGAIVEDGPAERILAAPESPYTRMLLDAAPRFEPRDGKAAPVGVPEAGCDTTDVLRLQNVSYAYGESWAERIGGRPVKYAVQDVSLAIRPGETFGIIGESGSGKSTVGSLMAQLLNPTRGEVIWQGVPTAAGRWTRKELARQIQVVFQNPHASFDPRRRIGQSLAEPLRIHRIGDGRSRQRRAVELLEMVGLNADYFGRFPHQVSGGQLQRVAIGRALALDPAVLILDEPTSALDVSIQAEILRLLAKLQQERPCLSMIFISHDLAVVRQIADRVAVFSNGRLVEAGEAEAVFTRPSHEYTNCLIAAAARSWQAER